MVYAIIFFITFHLFFMIASGGVICRIHYAFKVSNSILSFFNNYALSYLCSYSQIHSSLKFYPEVNAKLEHLLSLSLTNDALCGMSKNYLNEYTLRINKPLWFDGSRDTVYFAFDEGRLNDGKYLLSPSCFILAKKMRNLILEKSKKDADVRKNQII